MAGPTPTVTDINGWMYFTLNGLTSPGTIPPGGVKGFLRETGWDEKKGKGTKGATLTLTSAPPVKGSITLQLIGPGGIYAQLSDRSGNQVQGVSSPDFLNWDNFVANVLSIPADKQSAQGLNIFYPGFQSIGLTQVVVKSYSPLEYIGKGLYHAKIELIEWVQPPNASIVSTVQNAKPDEDKAAIIGAKKQDPRIVKFQNEIAGMSQGNQT
jgi:hypothetical protein